MCEFALVPELAQGPEGVVSWCSKSLDQDTAGACSTQARQGPQDHDGALSASRLAHGFHRRADRPGMCLPWLPFAMLQSWPFCWWVMVIVDHFSRCAVGFALFPEQPTAQQVVATLEQAASRCGTFPKYIISDHGVQFRSGYLQWCSQHGVKPRFGAIGRYGSIAVAERFILTLKNELTRRILVPLGLARMRSELVRFFDWYNVERPHQLLDGATPAEVLLGRF